MTLANLFDEPVIYDVPAYQRAYAWEDAQLKQFLEDLVEQPPGKPYYLGHFLFEVDGPGRRYVIDGQQRLTTIVLFFAAVIRELHNRDESAAAAALTERYIERDGAPRFRTVRADVDLFLDLIRRDSRNSSSRTRSGQRLVKSWDFFRKCFRSAETVDLMRWAAVIGTAEITSFTVHDKVQATQIFTLQNSRGKDLTQLELLKAYLVYQVYLHSPPGQENNAIESIERQFETIYTLCEEITLLKEDAVLRAHDHAYSAHWNSPTENLKTDLVAISDGQERVRYLGNYSRDLASSFRHVLELERLMEQHEHLADPLILDAPNAWPLLVHLYRDHGQALLSDPELRELLCNIEITLVKFEFQHGRSSNDLIGDCKRYSRTRDLQWLKGRYRYCAKHSFRHRGDFNHRMLEFLKGNYHYHRISRYILWKYENTSRLGKDHHLSPLDYLNRVAPRNMDSTLEHIAPQNPEHTDYNHEFVERHLNNIGNMLLMPHGFNASEGNRPPREKAESFAASSYATHRDVARRISSACDKQCEDPWCGHKIEERQDEILHFATRRWRLEVTSPSEDPESASQYPEAFT